MKIPDGKTSDNRTRFIDLSGKLWKCKICPKCYIQQQVKRNKKYKIKKEVKSIGVIRPCRECSKPLPTNRYFSHELCVAEIEFSSEFGEYIYG